METLNTQNQQANEAKKAYIMPESLKAKIKANEAYKKDMFSLSGLVRYCNSEQGTKILTPYIAKIGSTLVPKQITVKFIKENINPSKLVNKDGTDKTKFSFWLVLSAIAKHTKDNKQA